MLSCGVHDSSLCNCWTFSFKVLEAFPQPTGCLHWYAALAFLTSCFDFTIVSASGCCHLVNNIYCANMKDPTKIQQKQKITFRSLFSSSHFLDSFKTVIAPREGSRRALLIILLLGLFIVQNVITGELDILYIFLANIGAAHVFDYFFGLKNFLGAVALLVILPIAK